MSNTPLIELRSCPGAQQVMAAASELFSQHGVDAVSMQDIATRAGVSKANIFHHFESKERLYLEVIRDAVNNHASDVAAIIASTAPFEQRFIALMRARVSEMLVNERGTRLVMREVHSGNAERAKLLATQIFSEKVSQNIAFFEDARRRGELREGVDPTHGSMMLGACCMFYFNCRDVSKHMQAMGGPVIGTPEQFSQTICAVLSRGLSAPAVVRPRASSKAVQKTIKQSVRSSRSRTP